MKDFEQITLIQRVLDFVGGDNMFRRYAFEDGKWLLVQGYSLTVFEEPLVVEDLALMVRPLPLSSALRLTRYADRNTRGMRGTVSRTRTDRRFSNDTIRKDWD